MKISDLGVQSVVLKADDLGMGFGIGMQNFRRLFDMIADRMLCISIGAIGDVRKLPRSDLTYLRSVFACESFELWNHSRRHLDMTTLAKPQQLADTMQAQAEIEDSLGRRPRLYGAPYNKLNSDLLAALEESNEFDGVWLAEPDASRLATIPRSHICTPEVVRDATRQPELVEFQRRWQSRKHLQPVVLQFHPTAWNEGGFNAFAKCLDWLIFQNARFLTFREAIQVKKAIDIPVGRADPSISARAVAVIADVQAGKVLTSLPNEAYGALSQEFFATRYQIGTQRSQRALAKSGILRHLKHTDNGALDKNDRARVLDIGFGVGNWMIASAALAPSATVEGVDTHPNCVAITKKLLEELSFDTRLTIHAAPAERLPFADGRFHAAYCINSLNYMDVPAVLGEVWRVLGSDGQVVINCQTRAYFLGAAQAALAAGNPSAAASRFETLAYQAGFSLGFVSTPTRTRTYQAHDIYTMMQLLGFDVLVERAGIEEDIGRWQGESYTEAFVAVKSNSRLRNLRARKGTSSEIGRQLVHLGCHRLLLEAAEEGILGGEQLESEDLLAIARMACSPTDVEEAQLGTTLGRIVWRLNRKDWEGARSLSNGEKGDVDFLGGLAQYLMGEHREVWKLACETALLDSKWVHLAAAAACRLGAIEAASEIAATGKLPAVVKAARPFAVPRELMSK